MPQKTYMYDTQWNQLINAINTGDSSAIVTAISNIKTSIDNIYTRLNAVGFNSTQWDNLVDAINTGDSSVIVTALNIIKNSLDNITNAITNQSITVDLSNINSDNVSNLSNVTGGNVTNAFNTLNSALNNLYTESERGVKSGKGLNVRYFILGKFVFLNCINSLNTNVIAHDTLVTGLPIPAVNDIYIICETGYGVYMTANGELKALQPRSSGQWVTFSYMYLMK